MVTVLTKFETVSTASDLRVFIAGALRLGCAVLCLFVVTGFAASVIASDHLTVLLSLPAEHERQAREEIKRFFPAEQYAVDVDSLENYIAREPVSDGSDLGHGDIVLAAGSQSCQYALIELPERSVMCLLLSRESFHKITQGHARQRREKPYTAIVIDQPVKRQVQIANTVFPSLKYFGVLASEANARLQKAKSCARVQVSTYNENEALAPQITDIMSSTDALIALPDHNLYNSERLRTVLLTAYGYAKPVIGYSPSYVKAGALISTYTTTRQVFRQAAELLESSLHLGADTSMVHEPQYFSITDNASIAKSLGLVRRFRYAADHDYTDEDFSS